MFPNAKNPPILFLESFYDEAISVPVAGNFSFPVRDIAGRHSTVVETAMPEASVNKDGQFLLSKNEVGIAKKGEAPPPSREAGSSQEFRNQRLCRFIAMPANAGH